jgi:hypothetical protein
VRSSFKAGSYVGTGTFGKDKPCTLTFDFKPMMVLVYNPTGVNNHYSTTLMALHGAETAMRYGHIGTDAVYNTASYNSITDHFIWGDNSFSWYYSGGPYSGNAVVEACVQLNAEGVTYNYIAFGV